MEFFSFLPSTKQELNIWIFFSVLAFPAMATVIAILRGETGKIDIGFLFKYLYAGAAFPTFMLLATVLVREQNFQLIGDLGTYLTIAGAGGVVIAIASLFD